MGSDDSPPPHLVQWRRRRLAMAWLGTIYGLVLGSGLRLAIDVTAPAVDPLRGEELVVGLLFVIPLVVVVFGILVYIRRRWPETDFRPDIAALFGTPARPPLDPRAWLAANRLFVGTVTAVALACLVIIRGPAAALLVIAVAVIIHLASLVVVSLRWSGD